ncbi:hypothetical protein [Candidatus Odyssella thessalonicensis]|uniref:hypothetical protein n=1 Tax=Candidatus Odyssella thessalonicensis TaxID=84647 RepID=UPI000225ACF0|nr:hypothetical protein [Candidatus Odyssella thessalonicensis]
MGNLTIIILLIGSSYCIDLNDIGYGSQWKEAEHEAPSKSAEEIRKAIEDEALNIAYAEMGGRIGYKGSGPYASQAYQLYHFGHYSCNDSVAD